MTEQEYKNRKNILLNDISNGVIKNHDDCICSSLCSKCKGACCMGTPCGFSPDEFIDITDIDYMKSILDTGFLAIAELSLLENVLYIRPRGFRDLDTIYTGFVGYDNECIFLNDNGCILNSIYRPSEGLLLVPSPKRFGSGICQDNYQSKDLVKDWKKYRKTLLELKKIYKNKEIAKPEINEKNIKKYELKILGLKKNNSL